MNEEILYDGSFTGFLCAADEAAKWLDARMSAPTPRAANIGGGLFEDTPTVRSDRARARVFWRKMANIAGKPAMETCFEAFCSDVPGKDAAIFAAFRGMAAEGGRALDNLDSPEIRLVDKAAARTRTQVHLFAGLVRFAELADGTWYAAIKPDCDVLPRLATHFSERFPNLSFIVHDEGRAKALLHRPGAECVLAEGFSRSEDALELSVRERAVRQGWARYFTSVSIAERENRRAQTSRVPHKYRSNLPEFESPPLLSDISVIDSA